MTSIKCISYSSHNIDIIKGGMIWFIRRENKYLDASNAMSILF